MSSPKTIVVFGATGAQGGAVAAGLLKEGWQVRGVTRNPDSEAAKKLVEEGVTVVRGDMSGTYEELTPLFQGAYGAFVVTNFWDPSSTGKEKEQGFNLVNAAKASGVQHFVYSTLPNVSVVSNDFTDKAIVAEYLKKQGFPYVTLFSPAFYYQNWSTFLAPKKEDGCWVFTVPETSNITMFDVRDSGPLVAAILKNPEATNGKFVAAASFHGSLDEIVDTLQQHTEEKLQLVKVPCEEFAQFGFPGADVLADMFSWFNEFTYYGNEDRNSGLAVYPGLTTLETWAKTWTLPTLD